MRIAVVLGVLLAVAGAPRGAAACPKGARLLQVRVVSIGDDAGAAPVAVTEVRRGGAWTRTVDGVTTTGCLPAPRRALIRAAVAKARFRVIRADAACRARSTREITYLGPRRSQRARMRDPCGNPAVDDATRVAGDCLAAVIDGSLADDAVKETCAPSDDE